MNRRRFLRTAVYGSAAALTIGGLGYSFAEANDLRVVRRTVTVPNLPAAFRGTRIAFLTDIHHGPYVSLDYVNGVVRTTAALDPDLIVLGGDYISREAKYAGPCFEVLSQLKAPMGIYGVLGNHDYWHGERQVRDGMTAARFTDLTNRGEWLTLRGDRLRLCGVDDLWTARPNAQQALADARPGDAVILVSHNPDFAETLTDRRPGLILSGHTHGGQVMIPGSGAPIVPSYYGQKYARGLVEAPTTQVYVSVGIGLTGLPIRANCPPELTLLTLA